MSRPSFYSLEVHLPASRRAGVFERRIQALVRAEHRDILGPFLHVPVRVDDVIQRLGLQELVKSVATGWKIIGSAPAVIGDLFHSADFRRSRIPRQEPSRGALEAQAFRPPDLETLRARGHQEK